MKTLFRATPRWLCFGVAAVATCFLLEMTHADILWKLDGTRLVGEVLEENKKQVKFRMKTGTMEAVVWIDKDDIDRIEKGELPLVEFQKRLDQLDPADVDGHRELIDWCKKMKLPDLGRSVQRLLPEVEWRAFKKEHRLRWCRTCDARGEVSCVPCKGKGKTLLPCARCEGEGKLVCKTCERHDPPGQLRCKRCAGKGEIERFDVKKARKETTQCTTCRGTGTQECPDCDGKLSVPCKACEGTGGTLTQCLECKGEPKHVCPTCKGDKLQLKPLTEEEFAAEEKARLEAEEKARIAAEAKAKGSDSRPAAGGDGEDPATGASKPNTDPKSGDQRREEPTL